MLQGRWGELGPGGQAAADATALLASDSALNSLSRVRLQAA